MLLPGVNFCHMSGKRVAGSIGKSVADSILVGTQQSLKRLVVDSSYFPEAFGHG